MEIGDCIEKIFLSSFNWLFNIANVISYPEIDQRGI